LIFLQKKFSKKNFFSLKIANAAGLALNIATLSLYIIYPPKTWKVPIFGVGGGKELSDELSEKEK